jgi:acetyl-CoA carboxylase beta subunit
VQCLKDVMGVSDVTTGALWESLLDSGSIGSVETAGALSVVEGLCQGRPVRVATTDRSISGGSFGVDECDALSRHLERSLNDAMPFALVLDSGGARLDSGLAGLGAFRKLYRMALDVRLNGVPTCALMLRNCFGGASMLAMLCSPIGALRTARVGMSGPAIIEALSGKTDLDSSDRAAVGALFGAPARAETGAIDHVFDESELHSDILYRLIENSARTLRDAKEQHDRLRQRLEDVGVDLPGAKGLDARAAFRNGLAVGARDIWLLADEIISAPVGQPMTLIVDCPGQAATRRDESVVLSEYVAHLALCIRSHCAKGGEIVVHVIGESAGGIYVALAAGADNVIADPQAILRVLPAAAVNTVLRRTLPDETLADALDAGVVDRIVPVRDVAVSDRNAMHSGTQGGG